MSLSSEVGEDKYCRFAVLDTRSHCGTHALCGTRAFCGTRALCGTLAGTTKSVGAAMSPGPTKSAGAARSANATTYKEEGQYTCCTSRKKGGGGAQMVVPLQLRRAEDEDIPCGQKQNIDWLVPLSFPFTIPVRTPG